MPGPCCCLWACRARAGWVSGHGRGAEVGADVAEPPADAARGERPGGVGVLLPGAAEVAGEGAGEQELGVGGDDDPGPAVGLLGGADLRGGEAEGALQGADGVLDVEPCEVGAPELVQGQGAGAGVPEPELAVGVAAVGEPLGGDVDEGAAQDGQLVPAGEPAAVAVDLGVDVVPGLGPDGPVERGIRAG